VVDLRVRLFGHLSVEVDGAWYDMWPRPAARRLVALLALAPGHALSRDALVEHLFGHMPPDRGLRNVSKALSMARTVMGADRIAADSASVRLAGEVVTDLADAKRALDEGDDPIHVRAALSSVDDLLLDDMYEEWAQPHRWELQAMARRACLDLARATDSEEDWNRVAMLIPTEQEAWLSLLRYSERNGRSSVIETMRRCRLVWARESGGPLPAAVVAAADRLLANFGSPKEEVTVGRDGEMERVLASLDRGLPVLLVGPAGIGKTHLLRRIITSLDEHGHDVAIGTSTPGDRLHPFSSLRAAMQQLAVTQPSFLAGAAEGDLTPAGMATQLAQLLTQVNPPPAIVLDDVHWADPALKSVLPALASQAVLRKFRLLVAARSDEPGQAIPAWPSEGDVVSLRELSNDDSIELSRHFLGTGGAIDPAAAESLVQSLASRSGGNPFFLSELARAVLAGEAVSEGGEVPDRVAALMRTRIAGLDPESSHLVGLMALSGAYISAEMVLQLIGARGPELLQRLRERGLVASDGFQIVHPLLRDHVVAAMAPEERAAAHLLIADHLESLGTRASRYDLRVAAGSHRLAAYEAAPGVELGEGAVRGGLIAGKAAFQSFARQSAIRILESTYKVYGELSADKLDDLRGDIGRALVDLSQAWRLEGAPDKAEEWIHRALEFADSVRDRAHAYRAWASIPYRQGRMKESGAVLSMGLAEIDDKAARAVLESELAWTWHRLGRHAEAQTLLARAAQDLEDAADWEAATVTLDYLGVNLLELGRTDEALETLERAINLIGPGERTIKGILLMHRAIPLNRTGRTDEAMVSVVEGRRILERVGDSYLVSVTHWIEAEIRETRGEIDEAIACRRMELQILDGRNPRHVEAARNHIAALRQRKANTGNIAGTPYP